MNNYPPSLCLLNPKTLNSIHIHLSHFNANLEGQKVCKKDIINSKLNFSSFRNDFKEDIS